MATGYQNGNHWVDQDQQQHHRLFDEDEASQSQQLHAHEKHVEDNVELQDLREVVVKKEPGKILGFTIKKDGPSLLVGRLVSGGVCERSGYLGVGDALISVNEHRLQDLSLDGACELLGTLMGSLTFLVRPAPDKPTVTSQPQTAGGLILKALFRYSPETDCVNPCKQLGLKFDYGAIIHVVSKDSADWWQGYVDGDPDRIGIFPSPALQARVVVDWRLRFPFYERQGRLLPNPRRRRPLVLVGPPGVGRHELWARLIESEPTRFAPAVPYTTRQRGADEQNGLDYWFVATNRFGHLKGEDEFIETEQFNGDFYGTSVTSIQKVCNDGLVCVLALQPDGLLALRKHPARLMPFAVFISQANIDRLLELRAELAAYLEQPTYSDRQLRRVIEQGKHMKKQFRYLFDAELECSSLDSAQARLVEMMVQLQAESQWVPESWLRSDSDPNPMPDTEF